MLDKNKPYAAVRGSGRVAGYKGVRYMQDGKYFDGKGLPARKDDAAKPTPVVEEPKPAAPAPAPKPVAKAAPRRKTPAKPAPAPAPAPVVEEPASQEPDEAE